MNISEPASIAVLAGATATISTLLPVSSPGPHGLDLDRKGSTAFVACDGGHAIALDLNNGEETGRTAISGKPDAIWFNQTQRRIYVAVGEPGVIDVIDTDTMLLVETVGSGIGAHTSAFDQDRQRLYVFRPESCDAAIYEKR